MGDRLRIENKPIKILKRITFLTTFSINFDQNQNFYNFHDSEKILDDFLCVVQLKYLPTENAEFHGTFF